MQNLESEERYEIPTHIDDPAMFYFWEMDEFIAALFPFGVGIFIGYLFTGLALGVFTAYIIRTVKAKAGRGVVKHILYWYLPSTLVFKMRRTPPSYIREWR